MRLFYKTLKYNPYVDSESTNPDEIQGVQIDEGIEIFEDVRRDGRFREVSNPDLFTLQDLELLPDYTYFWFAEVEDLINKIWLRRL